MGGVLGAKKGWEWGMGGRAASLGMAVLVRGRIWVALKWPA